MTGAEAAVVLREIVDGRRRGRSGGQSGGGGLQSKSGPHSTLKENLTCASWDRSRSSTSVTAKGSCASRSGVVHQPQRVGREIAG